MSRSTYILHLLEAHQDDTTTLLYHVTTPQAAKKIYQENVLRGGFRGTGKIVSLTNSARYWVGNRKVRFVIDGTKLAQDYPIYPYINKRFVKNTKIHEYEFRVHGPITNFLSYCRRIDTKELTPGPWYHKTQLKFHIMR